MTINPDGRRQSLGAIPGSREPDPSCTGSGPSGFDPERSDFLHQLRVVNSARFAAWEGGTKADPLFHATELGGEVGEVLNVAKKLHREAMGWRGSRASVDDLADEIGDVLICLDKLAAQFEISLATATTAKFNKTSNKVGLPQQLVDPSWLCGACGASQRTASTHCAPPFTVAPHRFDGSHPSDAFRAAIRIEAGTGGTPKSGPTRSARAGAEGIARHD